MAQVALPGKYSGEAELKALCRLFSIRVIIIPGDPNWKVYSYGKPKYKGVVAIYFADKHFDFVKPKGKYSKEILSVVDDPNGGFLVGGVSEACSASLSEGTAGGAGLSQARTSVSSRTRPRGRGMSGTARTALETNTQNLEPADLPFFPQELIWTEHPSEFLLYGC